MNEIPADVTIVEQSPAPPSHMDRMLIDVVTIHMSDLISPPVERHVDVIWLEPGSLVAQTAANADDPLAILDEISHCSAPSHRCAVMGF